MGLVGCPIRIFRGASCSGCLQFKVGSWWLSLSLVRSLLSCLLHVHFELYFQVLIFRRRIRSSEGKKPVVLVVLIQIRTGTLKYNLVGKFFVAVCPVHERCTRQKTARPREGLTLLALGQGRPIGALACWLRNARMFETKEEHMLDPVRTRRERSEARQWFLSHSGAERFSAEHERPLRDGEVDPEPLVMK